ncbi:VWA domain-containing protein [Streptomyces violascens]|uniref:VWA domain-containing protein n=1 Tax=Streptomyces violascens TaxID=67381 RepID=UPI0019BF63A0|nr:VWA domain-containing protein [Streptomyces violascens]GGU49454.1 toxic cation resistance protein [Streptomyces violascens]
MFKKLFPGSSSTAASPATAPVRSTMEGLTGKAAHSLRKFGLSGQRAAVYLVLDRSGSMRPYYSDGTVQYLAERILGLARNLDSDGSVPVTFFSTDVDCEFTVSVDDYAGRIEAAHQRLGHMGRTNYATAIRAVLEQHRQSGETLPALIVFQTDGNPDDRADVIALLREIVGEGEGEGTEAFIAFVAFGKKVDFLHTLNDLGLKDDHVSRFQADEPEHITDEELYDGITHEFVPWLIARQPVRH